MKPSFLQKHIGSHKEHFKLLGDSSVDPNWWVTLDPTIPAADAIIGLPLEHTEPKPFANLSKPEDFPEEVQAIIDASLVHSSLFERILSAIG